MPNPLASLALGARPGRAGLRRRPGFAVARSPAWPHLRVASCSSSGGASEALGSTDVGVFWDASSCGPAAFPATPAGEVAAAAAKIQGLLAWRGRVVEKRVYDARGRESLHGGEWRRQLGLRGFAFVDCHEAAGDHAVVASLPVDVMNFVWQRARAGLPGVVVLISGDPSYAYLLSKVRDLGLQTVVLHPGGMTQLAAVADQAVVWNGSADAAPPEFQDQSGAPRIPGKLKAWAQLTPEEQSGASALGYNAAAWEGGPLPPTASKPWSDLKASERAAALSLGFAGEEWDAEALQPPATRPTAETAWSSPAELAARSDGASQAFEVDIALGLVAPLGAPDLLMEPRPVVELTGSGGAIQAAERSPTAAALSAEWEEALSDDIALGLVKR